MGMIPETEKPNSDFIDLLTTASSRARILRDVQGNERIELEINTKKLDYKLQLVNSNTFGRFIFTKERLENLCEDVFNYMEPERANVIRGQIIRLVESYGYSIDAKSSETSRDKNNSQSSAFHIMTKNKAERHITLKEDVKQSMWDSIRGKNKRDAVEGN